MPSRSSTTTPVGPFPDRLVTAVLADDGRQGAQVLLPALTGVLTGGRPFTLALRLRRADPARISAEHRMADALGPALTGRWQLALRAKGEPEVLVPIGQNALCRPRPRHRHNE